MIEVVVKFSLAILLVAFLLAIVRLIKGPSLPDRVVSLDLIAYLSMGIIILFAVLSDKLIYLDIVLTMALIVFVGTVIVSKYLKRKINDQ